MSNEAPIFIENIPHKEDYSKESKELVIEEKIKLDLNRKIQTSNQHKVYSLKTINNIRKFALTTTFIFLAITIFCISIYQIKGQNKSFILLCFLFAPDSYYPFHTSLFSLYICIFILFLQLIPIIYYFLKVDLDEIKDYLTQSSLFINATLLTISIEFLIGNFMSRTLNFTVIQMMLSTIGLIIISLVYFDTRMKVYNNIILLIGEYFLSGSLFSFSCYLLLFNVCDFLTNTPFDPTLHTKYKEYLNILCNFIYFSLGLISLLLYKDIIFSIIFIIIELGFLMRPKYSFFETLTCIIISSFMFYGLIFTVFKNQKKLFKFRKPKKFKFVPLIDNSMFNK